MENEFEEPSTGSRLGEDEWFVNNIMTYVFRHLEAVDLLRASRVCKLWYQIANERTFWRYVTVRECRMHFELMADFLERRGTTHLRLIDCIFMLNTDWIIKALVKMPSLRKIEFCECSSLLVEKLPEANRNLELINVNLIGGFGVHLHLSFVEKLPNLVRLSVNCNRDVLSLESVGKLQKLTHLSLTAVKNLNSLDLKTITSIIGLKYLALGDCWNLDRNFGNDVLKRLENLETIRLENCRECHCVEILAAISEMPTVRHLDLICINVDKGFNKALAFCTNLKKLTIVPNPRRLKSADGNSKIKDGVLQLKNTLWHFKWGFQPHYMTFAFKMFEAVNSVPFLSDPNDCSQEMDGTIKNISLYELEAMLSSEMPKTSVKIVIWDPKWPSID